MLYEKQNRAKAEVRDWIAGLDWGQTIVLTLTFPPSIAATREGVEEQAAYFWNVVDKRIFGNRATYPKKAQRCNRLNVIEPGRYRDNYHCHSLVEVPMSSSAKPKYQTVDDMIDLLETVWKKKMSFNLDKVQCSVDVEEVGDFDYWNRYITKTITDKNTDAICHRTTWLEGLVA